MNGTMRGFECTLYNSSFGDLLAELARESYDFYVAHYMTTDVMEAWSSGPQSSSPRERVHISTEELKGISEDRVMELVLHVYPMGSRDSEINTYEDFQQSDCVCCVIFYDCRMLEIYVKDAILQEKISKHLLAMGGEEMAFITDENDGRVVFYP